jgi:hypothetical protein
MIGALYFANFLIEVEGLRSIRAWAIESRIIVSGFFLK